MHRLYRAGAAVLSVALIGAARAQADATPPLPPLPPPLPLPLPLPLPDEPTAPGDSPPSPAGKPAKFEGAVGLVLAARPSFSGSSDRKLSPQLAGFVRYGRFTLTGAGGFTTRRQDDVERGLDAELVRRGPVRVNLALRFDPGRQQSDSAQLAGMGDIKATLRTRLGLRWQPAPRWSVSLASSVDSLGRGGGYVVDAGVARSFVIDARQRVIVGASMAAAGARYLQTWYGVNAAQAAASGYAPYRARAGLRDIGAGATWRIEINPQWAAFTALGTTRLLGAAADSPLTRQTNSFSLTAGLARRF